MSVPVPTTGWFGEFQRRPPEIGLAPRRIAAIVQEELRGLRPPAFPVALQPIVVPMASYRQLLRATADLLALLRRTVLHLAGDRDGRIAALGVDRADCPMFVDDEDFELRHCADMARADVVIGADGPKFIEFNVSGSFGGMADFQAYLQAWRRIGSLSGEPPLHGVDVWAALAGLVERVCAELGVPPSAVIVDHLGDWDPANTPRMLQVQVDGLRANGIRARHLELDQLLSGIGLPGPLREPLGLREFALDDARTVGYDIGPARAALDAGFRMIPSQTAWLLHSKKTLARLSEGMPWMSAEQRRLVEEYVPWSRTVGDRPVRWRDRWYPLPRLLVDRRECFVLKGATGCGGNEVVFGARTPPARWRWLVARAVATGYFVAQEVVESARYPVDVLTASGEVVRVAANSVISPFCLGGVPAGCLARFASTGRPGVVRTADGAVLTCLLAYP